GHAADGVAATPSHADDLDRRQSVIVPDRFHRTLLVPCAGWHIPGPLPSSQPRVSGAGTCVVASRRKLGLRGVSVPPDWNGGEERGLQPSVMRLFVPFSCFSHPAGASVIPAAAP